MASSALSSFRPALMWSRLRLPLSWTALANDMYAVLCGSISPCTSLGGCRSPLSGFVPRAFAATVEAATAQPEWKSKARRLILDVVTLLFTSRQAGSDAVNITSNVTRRFAHSCQDGWLATTLPYASTWTKKLGNLLCERMSATDKLALGHHPTADAGGLAPSGRRRVAAPTLTPATASKARACSAPWISRLSGAPPKTRRIEPLVEPGVASEAPLPGLSLFRSDPKRRTLY